MSGSKILPSTIAGAGAVSAPAFSQEESPAYKNEASVQAFGSFVKTTTSNGVDQSATNSGGVLASYRFFFNTHSGIEANYGYALNTQNFLSASGPLGEVSGAYVFRIPLRRLQPFVLAGAGVLVSDPGDFTRAGSQTRAAFLYGGGADFSISRHVFMRAEYRGFVYNSPTYNLTSIGATDRTTHQAEPSIGFGYRF